MYDMYTVTDIAVNLLFFNSKLKKKAIAIRRLVEQMGLKPL